MKIFLTVLMLLLHVAYTAPTLDGKFDGFDEGYTFGYSYKADDGDDLGNGRECWATCPGWWCSVAFRKGGPTPVFQL